MRTILITGASGFLGSNLVKQILSRGDTKVIAILGRPEDKAHLLPQSPNITILPCSELFQTSFGHVDTLVHTAFSRGDNLMGLTTSIELTGKVIEYVNKHEIDSFVNISTQGLYLGLKPGEKVNEEGTIGPNTAYGLAKWAVENMLKVGCKKYYTNIRMASLSTNARFLSLFVNCVKEGRDIIVTAPHQYASIMDVSDAVSGICDILDFPIVERKTIYNLGPGVQFSILDYAKAVNRIGQEKGFSPVPIIVDDKGSSFSICMDCKRLINDIGWNPKVTNDVMISKMF